MENLDGFECWQPIVFHSQNERSLIIRLLHLTLVVISQSKFDCIANFLEILVKLPIEKTVMNKKYGVNYNIKTNEKKYEKPENVLYEIWIFRLKKYCERNYISTRLFLIFMIL